MRLTPRALAALLPLAALALAACGGATDVDACTTEARPGLVVLVSDSLSGNAPVLVTVRATAGTFTDSSKTGGVVNGGGPATYALAYEHAGTYTVTVEAPNFRTWTRTGIVVMRGSCHVERVTLGARLQR